MAVRTIFMKRILLAITVLIVAMASTNAQSFTLDYLWLNNPCANNLNCSTGCSACDMPQNDSPSFFGTNMIWIGTDAPCPHPVISGDNAIYIGGWPVFALADHYGQVSTLSSGDMNIDSVIIVHRKSPDGPQRLKVKYSRTPAAPLEEAADVEITSNWSRTVILNLGCVAVEPNAMYGAFQLMVQPYQGGLEPWQVDEVRIVASPCNGSITGIEEHQRVLNTSGVYYDVLGRPVGENAAPGVYSGPRRVVQLP